VGPRTRLLVPQDQAVEKLKDQLKAGGKIANPQDVTWSSADSFRADYEHWAADWRRWESFTADLLSSLFSDVSRRREFLRGWGVAEQVWGSSASQVLDVAGTRMAARLNTLQSIIERTEAGFFTLSDSTERTQMSGPTSARLIAPQAQVAATLAQRRRAGTEIAANDPAGSNFIDLHVAADDWLGRWHRWEQSVAEELRSSFDDGSVVDDFAEGPSVPQQRLLIEIGAEETISRAKASMQTRLKKLGSIIHDVEAGEFLSESVAGVFVVYGHDTAARESVARYVERLGLEAILLDEQIDPGKTIIEALEHHATRAGAAIVLLTPDDVGRAVDAETLNPRARQNVVFELGYFAAWLGRGRVIALRRGAVEIPSDYQGVKYITFDDHSGWQLTVAQHLHAIGLPVDLGKLFPPPTPPT
jgi:predicted nucleotide-binding protein